MPEVAVWVCIVPPPLRKPKDESNLSQAVHVTSSGPLSALWWSGEEMGGDWEVESPEGISQRRNQNTPSEGLCWALWAGAIRVQFACVFQGEHCFGWSDSFRMFISHRC